MAMSWTRRTREFRVKAGLLESLFLSETLRRSLADLKQQPPILKDP